LKIHPLLSLAIVVACSPDPATEGNRTSDAAERGFEPPVLINPESPVAYPVDLFEREVEASVVLRLFVTAEGTIDPDSTQVAESSGYPALDAAALAGVPDMRFAPARRDGQPVATLFLQPVHFRHPSRTESGETP
jgi:protein TonB